MLILLAAVLLLLLAPQVSVHSASIKTKKLAGDVGFNCIQQDGTLYSWGHSYLLGRGLGDHSAFPIQTPNVREATDVATGFSHVCVVDGGALKCAGENTNGQLGRPWASEKMHKFMRPAKNLQSGVKAVFASPSQTFAVMNSGKVYAFGSDAYGSLGVDLDDYAVFTPTRIAGFKTLTAMAVAASGYHSCIVTTGGTVQCTGRNNHGELGMGHTNDLSRFASVTGLKNMVQVACGSGHTCVMTSAGAVQCFGKNDAGQMGTGNQVGSLTPVPVIGFLPSAMDIVARGSATCVVYEGARNASCFGAESNSKFANGQVEQHMYLLPVQYGRGIAGIAELRLGSVNSAILLTDGTVHVVGSDYYGQIGDGKKQDSNVLRQTWHLPKLPPIACVANARMTKSKCNTRAKICKQEGKPMRWTGASCKVKRKSMLDGGCQCAWYCGFTCKRACIAAPNRKYCKWEEGQCRNKLTGAPPPTESC